MAPHGWDLWGDVSAKYSKDAIGDVEVIQDFAKFPAGGSTWRGREWPTIVDEGKVTSLNKMTAAFDNFMQQHDKTGNEKADGYSRDVFIGLEGTEKEIVFDLLVKELPFSVEWLFFLDADKALPVVKKEEERLKGDGYGNGYLLQEELVRFTGDLSYQDRMIEDYPAYTDSLKPLVVDAIGRTPANIATIEFFKRVILTEVNSSAVARAARRLLAALAVPRSTASEENVYSRIVSDLRNDSLDVKLRALKLLQPYEANLA